MSSPTSRVLATPTERMASSPSGTQRAQKTTPRESWSWLRLKVWRLQMKVAARARALRRTGVKTREEIANGIRWLRREWRSRPQEVSVPRYAGLDVPASRALNSLTRAITHPRDFKQVAERLRSAVERIMDSLEHRLSVQSGMASTPSVVYHPGVEGLQIVGPSTRSTVLRRLVQVSCGRLRSYGASTRDLVAYGAGKLCLLCGAKHSSLYCLSVMQRELALEEQQQALAWARFYSTRRDHAIAAENDQEDHYSLVVEELFRVANSIVSSDRLIRRREVASMKLAVIIARRVIPLSAGILRKVVSELGDLIYIATGARPWGPVWGVSDVIRYAFPMRGLTEVVVELAHRDLEADSVALAKVYKEVAWTIKYSWVTASRKVKPSARMFKPAARVTNSQPLTAQLKNFTLGGLKSRLFTLKVERGVREGWLRKQPLDPRNPDGEFFLLHRITVPGGLFRGETVHWVEMSNADDPFDSVEALAIYRARRGQLRSLS
jgi:broad specificity phosphatase PhoE